MEILYPLYFPIPLMRLLVKLYSLCAFFVLFALFFSCGDNFSGTSATTKHGEQPPPEAGLTDIQVVASGLFPPYYAKGKNGAMTGVTAEIVRNTIGQAGIRTAITTYPVKRALLTAEKHKNVLIFAIFRTPERESHFKWIAPVTPPIRSVLFRLARRQDVVLESLSDAAKYKTGVVRGNDLHQLLQSRGFKDELQLEPVMYNDLNVRKLFAGRVDLCAGRELPFFAEMQQLGFDKKDVVEALELEEDVAWMAFSLSTSDDVVERVRKAFRQIEADGTVSRIYGLHNTVRE